MQHNESTRTCACVGVETGSQINGRVHDGGDNDGNLVVVGATTDVFVFSPTDGKLLKTLKTAQTGNDGIVIMKDGTIYISSVQQGGIARIRPGQAPELIATGIPSAASMCYDSGANQLVIPMNQNNAMAIVKLQ